MLNKIYDPIFNALLLKPNCSNSNELFKTVSYGFLFIMTIGFILNMRLRFKLILSIFKQNKIQSIFVIYLLIKILTDTFMLLFMYNACLTCNGLYGLLYMVIFLFIIDLILGLIFRNVLKKSASKAVILINKTA